MSNDQEMESGTLNSVACSPSVPLKTHSLSDHVMRYASAKGSSREKFSPQIWSPLMLRVLLFTFRHGVGAQVEKAG